MTARRMFIDKFAREVLIDHEHPLAVAQRAKAATADASAVTTDTRPAIAPAVSVTPDAPLRTGSPRRRR